MSKPITPREALKKKEERLPDEVFDAFNEMIADNLRDGVATFKAKDVAALIRSKLQIKGEQVYDKGYMDVEPLYRKAGWKVEYDQPAYCESYDATYTFSAKRSRDE